MTDVSFGDAGGLITETLTDAVREELVGQPLTGGQSLMSATIARANGNLERWADQEDWDMETLRQAWDVVVDERGGTIAIRLENTHRAAEYIEFGTSSHTINGQPVLSFVWEDRFDPPGWVAEEFERDTSDAGRRGYRVFFASVDVAGIPETRFLREALDFLRREMERRFDG